MSTCPHCGWVFDVNPRAESKEEEFPTVFCIPNFWTDKETSGLWEEFFPLITDEMIVKTRKLNRHFADYLEENKGKRLVVETTEYSMEERKKLVKKWTEKLF